jgi:hypothetical protein
VATDNIRATLSGHVNNGDSSKLLILISKKNTYKWGTYGRLDQEVMLLVDKQMLPSKERMIPKNA